ncbi:MAG TPA: energy transducer TonB [bacterium]|nr:energy transducer TonB [bacterium]
MKRLSLPIIISVAAHVLILAGLGFWASRGGDLPLSGSGGGSGVTVEIVGGTGMRGENGEEVKDTKQTPQPPDLKTTSKDPEAPKTAAKVQKTKAKKGSREGDDVPVGTPGPSGPGQGPGAPGPGSGDAGGSNAVLAEIHARIERAKRYPVMARKMQMEGDSFVRFAIDAGGQPKDIAIKTTSGYPVLDEEALATIRRAAPYPPYADSLVVGIRFHLER